VAACLLAATLGALVAGCAGTRTAAIPAEGEAAIRAASASVPALVQLSDSALALGDVELSRRALARAASLEPGSAALAIAYGRHYTALHRYADAKESFERAATIDPRSPEPHHGLALAYLKAGDKDAAYRELSRALALDPAHAASREAIRPLEQERYRAAGIPVEYADLPTRSTITRGELGVVLSVELGVDPDRPEWRSDAPPRMDWPVLENAWGARWLRAAIARSWVRPYADDELHLDDPVTRGGLALLVAELAPPANAPPARYADIPERHYLSRAASAAGAVGLPIRDGNRFEPQAFATGGEALEAVRGLARARGATPVVSGAPAGSVLVK
jgi:tetratricopeptide (TPR) repeat protein